MPIFWPTHSELSSTIFSLIEWKAGESCTWSINCKWIWASATQTCHCGWKAGMRWKRNTNTLNFLTSVSQGIWTMFCFCPMSTLRVAINPKPRNWCWILWCLTSPWCRITWWLTHFWTQTFHTMSTTLDLDGSCTNRSHLQTWSNMWQIISD